MKILLTKLTNDRHALEIVRKDGSRDRVELETKSLWLHDFLHLAVESEANLHDGFWGSLASGKSFADMNDRSGAGTKEYAGTMLTIEMLVGALTGAAKGAPPATVVANIRSYLESVGKGDDFPAWLTPEFVLLALERLRKLVGHWNATPFGKAMEVEWVDQP
jgi:hypothetical protein